MSKALSPSEKQAFNSIQCRYFWQERKTAELIRFGLESMNMEYFKTLCRIFQCSAAEIEDKLREFYGVKERCSTRKVKGLRYALQTQGTGSRGRSLKKDGV